MQKRTSTKGLFRWLKARRIWLASGGSLLTLWSTQTKADMNLIEVFLASNDLDCVDLYLEGFCMWLVIVVTWTGIDVSLELTPKISHYNPELLVSTTGRINTSPSIEGNMLYGRLEREFSKPMLRLMTGHDVPAAYDNTDLYSSQSGDSGRMGQRGQVGSSSTYAYSEVDVLGAPGNAFTLYADGVGTLGDIPTNALNGVQSTIDAVAGLPGVIEQSAQASLPGGGANRVDNLGEEPGWAEHVEVSPTLIASLILGEDVADKIGEAEDIYQTLDAGDFALTDNTVAALEDAQDEVDEAISGLGDILGDVNTFLDSDEEVSEAVEEAEIFGGQVAIDDQTIGEAQQTLTEVLMDISIDELVEELGNTVEEVTAQLAETMESVEQLQQIVEGFQAGGGVTVHPFRNFCRRDSDTFKPYFLSGLDVVGWRMRIPEMVFPETYGIPLSVGGGRFTGTEHHVGTFGGMTQVAGINVPDWNYWGPIYPRAGGILQPDTTKARAVAASRAVHLVTRTGQPHIYWPLTVKDKGDDWRYEGVDETAEFDPQNERSGRWQLLDTGVRNSSEHSCLRFGDNDTPANSYANQAYSEESRFLYNLWRQSTCCEDPNPSNGYSRHIGNIDLRIKLL